MVKAPFIKPDPPIPLMARPSTNIDEETAVAQTMEPSSKIATKARNENYGKYQAQ
jgi:hypothetical protein